MEPRDEKLECRDRVRALLRLMTPEERLSRSQAICEAVVRLPEFVQAKAVMIFLSMPREVETSTIAEAAWQSGKRVLAPKLFKGDDRMVAVELRDLTNDLVISDRRFREPVGQTPFPVVNMDFVLVPGLGFDRSGSRLGRGGGHYDRFLADSDFRGWSCGLAFEGQLCDCLPVGPLDRPVDMLVTEVQVYRFTNRREGRPVT